MTAARRPSPARTVATRRALAPLSRRADLVLILAAAAVAAADGAYALATAHGGRSSFEHGLVVGLPVVPLFALGFRALSLGGPPANRAGFWSRARLADGLAIFSLTLLVVLVRAVGGSATGFVTGAVGGAVTFALCFAADDLVARRRPGALPRRVGRSRPALHHVRLGFLSVTLVGFVAGPFFIWQALDDRALGESLRQAKPCEPPAIPRDCLITRSATVVMVTMPRGNPSPRYLATPGYGLLEPQLLVRPVTGGLIPIDVGYGVLPKVGETIELTYYHGYLLRAVTRDGRRLAIVWVPGSWLARALAGAGLLLITLLVVAHRVRRSRGDEVFHFAAA